ncbi:MAG: PepSY domain-containing protein [Acutalibacteraceae bacterium]|jgi:hypothetical protein
MKNNIRTKLLGLALTTTMALSVLTACGSSAETASLPSLSALPSAAASSQEESNASVGTVLLSVNPEIEMDYDGHGNVTALTGRNQDAQALLSDYTGYEGRPCTEVIGELVQEISARGYFDTTVGGKERNVILKLEQGSAYPTDQFLEELAGAVRQVVAAEQNGSQPVLLDQDDYDDVYGDKGYINASAAQSILSAQLGRDDLQFVEKDYDLDDGEYEVEFVLDGVTYEYEVNAYTGKITEVDVERQDDGNTSRNPDRDDLDDDWDDADDADDADDWDDDDDAADDWDDDDDVADDWDDDDDVADDWDDDDDVADDWDDDDDVADDWDDADDAADDWDDADDVADDWDDADDVADDWDDDDDDSWDDDDWDDDDWDDDDWDDDDGDDDWDDDDDDDDWDDDDDDDDWDDDDDD